MKLDQAFIHYTHSLIMPPLQLISIFLLLSPLFSSGLIAKPGCPDQCGDLPIPYPFGVGLNCSLNPYFNINCNTSTDPPKAYLSFINKHVIEINESYIRLRNPYMISACYDSSADNQLSLSVNLSGTPYTLPSYVNVLTAVGCDDMVRVRQPEGSSDIGGCSAFCADKNDTGGVGYCPFNGCCQLQSITVSNSVEAQLIDLSGKSLRRKLFPCSYAFIQEKTDTNEIIFSYPLYYLHNSTALLNDDWASAARPPLVLLNWRAGTKNCNQARNSAAYACLDEKSVCVDYNGRGYTCSCVQGYEGSPYLKGGCQAKSFSSSIIAKSGCLDQCGRIPIPFPFGVGPNCYLEPSFEVFCNTTTNPPKAYLINLLNAEIIELNSSKVLVNYMNLASSTCYNLSDPQIGTSKPQERRLKLDLLRTPYTLSDENWITAIGCDSMVVGVIGEDKRSSIRSSCAAICSDRGDNFDNAICAYGRTYQEGDGCCRVPIPRGTSYLEANLTNLSGRWPRTIFSCSYAFIEYLEKEYTDNVMHSSSLPLFNNSDVTRIEHESSVALDWKIRAVNCTEARRNPAKFVCGVNTDCVDFDATVGGYICNCSKGYQGNPYLDKGCIDIDECADSEHNPCDAIAICINTVGSANCSCPKGYDGDGRKNSEGCRRLQSSSHMIKYVVIGLGSALGLLLLLLLCFWLHNMFEKRKNRKRKESLFKHLLLQQQTSHGTFGKTKLFTAKELEKATDHFNESRICGRGGQGVVYKGMLSDGTIVAIKKLKEVDENQVDEFINEVVILSQINHKNVVKLLGCCLATEAPLLVYEFLPNGTLFDFIHDPKIELPLTWNMRLKIVADVAGALAYLHSASSIPIYHRDIKSTNILLDEKYVVKVSDFGTSKVVQVDQTHITTLVKGTFGYLDPEYYQTSQYTEKSDVYSFGVVLVELLTGQRPISLEMSEVGRNLAAQFLASMDANNLDDILDAQVREHGEKEDVIAVARLAERCLNDRGIMRPTMEEVAIELKSLMMSQIPSIVDDEPEETSLCRAKRMMVSDTEYSWTSSYHIVATSSPDAHPLMHVGL